MEDNLAELDKLVQAIHKREKSMSVYECYATALQIQTLSELSNISTALVGFNFELNRFNEKQL